MCLLILLPGLFAPPSVLNLYIRAVDFTGIIWILGLQPFNYPRRMLILRPIYLLLPAGMRKTAKAYASKSYKRGDFYRNIT
jgi:hypothetical protein